MFVLKDIINLENDIRKLIKYLRTLILIILLKCIIWMQNKMVRRYVFRLFVACTFVCLVNIFVSSLFSKNLKKKKKRKEKHIKFQSFSVRLRKWDCHKEGMKWGKDLEMTTRQSSKSPIGSWKIEDKGIQSC